MKRITTLFLILCLLITSLTILTSCFHECKFSDEWDSNDDEHWHECTSENCEEIDGKEDHSWDDGEITEKATQEKDGVMTFTCDECGHTKTEAITFTGLTEEEWNDALTITVFENFAYKEVSTTTGSGVSVDTETNYKFTKDLAYLQMTVASQTQEQYVTDEPTLKATREALVKSIKDMVPYSSFKYDAESKTYKATKDIFMASINASTSDITLTFSEGKLVEAKYSISFTQENINFSATSTITITNYGTVVLARPFA